MKQFVAQYWHGFSCPLCGYSYQSVAPRKSNVSVKSHVEKILCRPLQQHPDQMFGLSVVRQDTENAVPSVFPLLPLSEGVYDCSQPPFRTWALVTLRHDEEEGEELTRIVCLPKPT